MVAWGGKTVLQFMGGKTVTLKGRQNSVLHRAAKLVFSSGGKTVYWVVNIKEIKMLVGKEKLSGKTSGDLTVAASI